MFSIKKRKVISLDLEENDVALSDDSDADSLSKPLDKLPVSKTFSLRKPKHTENVQMDDVFVVDVEANNSCDEIEISEILDSGRILDTTERSNTVPQADKKLEKLLAKAKCGPAFEKEYGTALHQLSRRAEKRKRKEEREKTAGSSWFHMPATELTEERRRDLELLQMRNAIDPTAHYRAPDRETLPKYFQVGRIVDAPQDYYSSRMTKKERKNTMVDELLADSEFQRKKREEYNSIKARESKVRRGAFQHHGKSKKEKGKSAKGKKGKK